MSSEKPSPFAPHWLIRDMVIGAHMAAAGPGGLLFLGDSIVEGFYWNRIGAYPVVNAGYTGIWTEALQPKVSRLLDRARPGLVALLVGTNDAKKGQGAAEINTVAGFYEEIVATLAETGLPLIVITPPPVETGKRLTGFYAPEALGALSGHILRIAGSQGVRVIDMHAAFSDGAGAKPGTTVDGVHLSPAAYHQLHDRLEQAVGELTDSLRGSS